MLLTKILISIVAGIHFYFMILEMFLWTTPKSLRAFNLTLADAQKSKALAANQGLYNGFLAVGLVFSMVQQNPIFFRQNSIFFLTCIIVAALYGGYTVNQKILLIQGIPALLAITSIFIWI